MESMVDLARSLGVTSSELRIYLGILEEAGFARNPGGGFVWEITDEGRAELEKLRKTPEGRKALGED